jgi:hypothetical protein
MMIDPHDISSDVAFWIFLDELKNNLRAVREDQHALRLTLRRSCEHFKVDDGCIAVVAPDGSHVELIAVIPRGGRWDLDCLAAFLQKQRPRIPPNIIMAPIQRRGGLWGGVGPESGAGFRDTLKLYWAKAHSELNLRNHRGHRPGA